MAIVINGSGTVTGITAQASDVELTDSTKIMLGTSDDLQIYHDGSDSYIDEQGTGTLTIRATDLNIKASDNSRYITGVDGGYCRLWYAGTDAPKLETTSTGIDVTGVATTDGLTSSGNITFDTGSSSVSIRSDGSNGSYIQYGSGEYLRFLHSAGGGETMRLHSNGKVSIGTTLPYGKFEVGTLGGNNNYNGNSAIRTGVTWDSEATTHTIPYPDYCVGDTSSGMMIVHAKADGNTSNAKAGTLLLLWTKTHGEALTITSLHSHDQKISSFSVSTSGNDIVVTTDSDCAITWHSLFGR